MPRIEPFEKYSERYEDWFYNNKYAYQSEINSIKEILPDFKKGVEIGVGSGRFAEPLGIKYGVEPSDKMRRIATSRGIEAVDGVAEELPYESCSFDLVLMVTTLCFLDDVKKAFSEVYRILEPGGFFVNGFVDKNSKIGKIYQKHKEESVFYRMADFFSAEEVIGILKETGFKNPESRQTIFTTLDKINGVEEVRAGHGKGSFVVIKSRK
jgi:ubiquinone/menaquinone biosynthesis C-methylase UbiE